MKKTATTGCMARWITPRASSRSASSGRTRGRYLNRMLPHRLTPDRLEAVLQRLRGSGFCLEAEELNGHIQAIEQERPVIEADGRPVRWADRIVTSLRKGVVDTKWREWTPSR